jgi:serine/threonine protein kinase
MSDVESTVSSRRLPSEASGYELVEQIGTGSGTSGVVFRALCQEIEDEVAVRIIDLDQLQASLEDISKDIKVMSLSSHPNVLPFSTCFVAGNDLWVVMPLLTGGSVTSLFTCVYPDGLPSSTAIYILHSALKALDYFHSNGQIHRDVRAANILLDARGEVMLSDYGMMGWMVEGGWERKQRQTFVGTPCWMAPEVMEQTSGYDYKADIWSVGITAIELAMGAAPYANYPAMKVLVMTLQNPPPTLLGRAAETFPELYHDFVAACLEKDPELRPTARQLLLHPLFEDVEMPSDLPSVLASLPPVGSRAGAAQKMLYRQMQKAIAPSGSGIWNKPTDRRGWDFDDDAENANEALPTEIAPPRPFMGQSGLEGSDTRNGNPLAAAPPARAVSTPGIVHNSVGAGSVSTRTFPLVEDGGSSLNAPSYRDVAAEPLTRHAEATAVTPANTPYVTPANLTTVPAISPDGEPRVSLPPSASNGEPASVAAQAGHCVSAGASGNQYTVGGAAAVPAIPNKSGVLQKKGRFTVSDVDVSAEKLNAKLNNFIDDDLDMSTSASQYASTGGGGAISNSSSFTSLPGGPSTETSPTSAVQNALPVVGRAALPVGMEGSAEKSSTLPPTSLPPSASGASKEGRKGRFDVSPVEQARGQGPSANQALKTRARFETKDLPDSGQHAHASVTGDISSLNRPHSRSPNAGLSSAANSLPSTRSKDSLPTYAVRNAHGHSTAVANQGPMEPLQAPSGPAAGTANSSLVQSLTQCIAALSHECDSLRLENENLRRNLAEAHSVAEPELTLLRQQLTQLHAAVTSQQAVHDKSIQQLQQKLQMLQRLYESISLQSSGRQQVETGQQPPQVVKLVQGPRSHEHQSQSQLQLLSKAQVGIISPAGLGAGSHASASTLHAVGHGSQVGVARSQLQPQLHQPAPYTPADAVSGAPLPSRGQHVRQPQPDVAVVPDHRSVQHVQPPAPQGAMQAQRQGTRAATTGQRLLPTRPGGVTPSSETSAYADSLSPAELVLEDEPLSSLSTSDQMPLSTSTSQYLPGTESGADPTSGVVDIASGKPAPSQTSGARILVHQDCQSPLP